DFARAALVEFGPHAQRAFAAAHRNLHGQPFPPCGNVGIVDSRIKAAVEPAPVGEREVADVAAQIERRRQLRRRNATEAEAVVAEAILQPKLDPFQDKLRAIGKFVTPHYGGIVYENAWLPEEPLSEWLVIAAQPRLECRSRDMQDARRVATNDKLRPV